MGESKHRLSGDEVLSEGHDLGAKFMEAVKQYEGPGKVAGIVDARVVGCAAGTCLGAFLHGVHDPHARLALTRFYAGALFEAAGVPLAVVSKS